MSKEERNYHIETKCQLKAGAHQDAFGSLSVPIYQTATFEHRGIRGVQHADSCGFDYTRVSNPTREQLEAVMALLEGGNDAMAFSTGMAAIDVLMELFQPGDHIIVDGTVPARRPYHCGRRSVRRQHETVRSGKPQKRTDIHGNRLQRRRCLRGDPAADEGTVSGDAHESDDACDGPCEGQQNRQRARPASDRGQYVSVAVFPEPDCFRCGYCDSQRDKISRRPQ